MSSLFSKALVYLGLVDEDQSGYDQGDTNNNSSPGPEQTESRRVEPRRVEQHRVEPRRVEASDVERRVEPPPTGRAANVAQSRSGSSSYSGPMVRPVEIQSDILLVEEFADARALADRIRDRTPVVLDMRNIDGGLVRRIVDFSSGLIYALDGSMRKVGDGLVLVVPPRVTLSRDEKRRLAALGAYELTDIED
ncbi:MAG: cell division protein SepF [Acidimicrobiia bacterium]